MSNLEQFKRDLTRLLEANGYKVYIENVWVNKADRMLTASAYVRRPST